MKIVEELAGALILSEGDIERILAGLGWTHIIDSIAETFIKEAEGEVVCPPKTIIDIPIHKNDYRTMPAYMNKYSDFCGTKIISACPFNFERDLPLAMGIYVLNNAQTQEVLMICPANLLTAYRTAAATAVAVKELANDDAKVLGVIGCGQQAFFHIPAICAVRNIKEILIYDINERSMDLLFSEFRDMPKRRSIKSVIFRKADIVVTLTPTTKPHIFTKDIPDREMLICAVGGDSENKIEFSPEVLTLVDYFCDSLEQAAHTGIVSNAIERGYISRDNLKSLGSLMTGNSNFDESKKIKMFLSTGVALQDLAIAAQVWEKIKGNEMTQQPAFKHYAIRGKF